MKFWFPLGVALLASFSKLEADPPASASSAPTLEVTTTNGDGREEHNVSRDGRVPLVLVRPNQAVPVTLQFPSDKAGMAVAAIPLDGGEVNSGHLAVLPTGKVIFIFKPGPAPGRYRLVVQTPVERHLLEFYVVDPDKPVRRSPARGN